MDDNEDSPPARQPPPGLPGTRQPGESPGGDGKREDLPKFKNLRRKARQEPVVVHWNRQEVDGTREPVRPPHSFSKAEDERQRLLQAAGLSSSAGTTRIGGGDYLLFRCPGCLEQQTCAADAIGQIHLCDICGAKLQVPEPDSPDRIVLLKPGRRSNRDLADLPVALPTERSEDGPGGKKNFLPVDEFPVQGEDGLELWGLSKDTGETLERPRFQWKRAAAICFLLAVIVVAFLLLRPAARFLGGESPAPEPGATLTDEGKLDWGRVSEIQAFVMAERKIRDYLSAPDLAAKSRLVRGAGPEMEHKMAGYYSRQGGFEPETHIYGDIAGIESGETRLLGGRLFRMIKVNFALGASGVYALAPGARDFEVDWEYAVGFGQMPFDQLLEEKPTKPVLLRVYMTEGWHFNDGFDSDRFRSFEITDAKRQSLLYAYVLRGGPVERELIRFWSGVALDSIGTTGAVPEELDFIIRLHHEHTPLRTGFLIDEVLNRGWILPDKLE